MWISDMKIKSVPNTQTKFMKLQFGQDKGVKMQIVKKHNIEKCGEVSVDAWSELLMTILAQTEHLQDIYMGKEDMKNVREGLKKIPHTGDNESLDRCGS